MVEKKEKEMVSKEVASRQVLSMVNRLALLHHAFTKTLIAGYKCPRSVEITQTPLPLSGAGKVLKRDLRKPFWENQDRDVS